MDLRILADSQLPVLRSRKALEVGRHLSRFLGATKVTPVDGFVRPARVGGVRIGAFSVALVEVGAPASIEAFSLGDYAVMMLCLHGSAQMEVDGRTILVLANHGLLGFAHGVVRATFSGDCARLVVRIDPRLIERRSLFSTARFELSNPAIEPFLEQVHSVLSSRAMIAAIDNEPSVRTRVKAVSPTAIAAGSAIRRRQPAAAACRRPSTPVRLDSSHASNALTRSGVRGRWRSRLPVALARALASAADAGPTVASPAPRLGSFGLLSSRTSIGGTSSNVMIG